jgi:hypothetical protein
MPGSIRCRVLAVQDRWLTRAEGLFRWRRFREEGRRGGMDPVVEERPDRSARHRGRRPGHQQPRLRAVPRLPQPRRTRTRRRHRRPRTRLRRHRLPGAGEDLALQEHHRHVRHRAAVASSGRSRRRRRLVLHRDAAPVGLRLSLAGTQRHLTRRLRRAQPRLRHLHRRPARPHHRQPRQLATTPRPIPKSF